MNPPSTYRADIDGLRFLASALVLLFHFKVPFFGEGFLGVDMFLVISGYLIYGTSLSQLASLDDAFEFWKRRIARILPVLTLVIIVSLIAARILFSVFDLPIVVTSSVWSSLFGANVYFWLVTNYFTDTSLNPFFHLWSIGLEEQFYLLLPLVLLPLRSHARMLLVALGLVSLVAFGSVESAGSAFYLLPFRMWEFCLGAMIATLTPLRSSQRSDLVAVVSLIVLAAWFSVAESFHFWRGTQLPVAFATAGLIYAGSTSPLLRSLLGAKIFTSLGRCSYSIYLLHWPIWIFAKSALDREPLGFEVVALIVLTMTLSFSSFFFVERPALLKLRSLPRKRVYLLGFAMITAPLLCAAALYLEAKLLRIPHIEKTPLGLEISRQKGTAFYDSLYRRGTCLQESAPPQEFPLDQCLETQGASKILIWGDSYGAQLYAGLRSRLAPEVSISQVTRSGCAPVRQATDPMCNEFFDFVKNEVLPRLKPDIVILAGNWQRVPNDTVQAGLVETIGTIENAKVVAVGLPPVFQTSPIRLIPDQAYSEMTNEDAAKVEIRVPAKSNNVPLSKASTERLGASYVDVTGEMCEQMQCLVVSQGRLLYWEPMGHVTAAGSDKLAEILLPHLRLNARANSPQ